MQKKTYFLHGLDREEIEAFFDRQEQERAEGARLNRLAHKAKQDAKAKAIKAAKRKY